MYLLIDGTISIVAGVYVYLAAIGRVPLSSDEEKSKLWIQKYGKPMKVIGPLVALFGIFRFGQFFFAN